MKNLKKLSLRKETVEMLDSTRMNNIFGGDSEVVEPAITWKCTEQYHCTFTVVSYYYECPATQVCSDYMNACEVVDTGDCEVVEPIDSVWECIAIEG